jgi:hypothetical protein
MSFPAAVAREHFYSFTNKFRLKKMEIINKKYKHNCGNKISGSIFNVITKTLKQSLC